MRTKSPDPALPNEQKRAEYQGHLEEIETRLAQVEKNFADPKPA